MNQSEVYVVTGVTGRTGSAVAKALLKAGKAVRVVVREEAQATIWTARGAEVAVADFNHYSSLKDAFKHAAGAYIVSPPQYRSERLFQQAEAMADTIARAAKDADLPKIVALSSIGAEQVSGTGWITMNNMLEQALIKTGLAVTLLRAAYFMENWQPLIEQALAQRKFLSFLAPLDKTFPMIATDDIGQLAAQALCEQWKGTRVIDLEGPARYSPNEVADFLSKWVGEEIHANTVPTELWPNALKDTGFSSAAITGFTEMTQGINAGHICFDDSLTIERRRGVIELGSVLKTMAAIS